ncbi:carbohydrate ABC transporter permease [Paenibacillus radicis (ex Gao et al. 2016)]|uniref:Sugar ABC transporter permease n=1 Tax=Paenibacillus radicis (ex Gao et al. 2016) TaxID=1737354 RepID=A0A917M5C2_9BACL|nr:carbohydrate ABC transporter permease [Paenibacillus radicis (ex Gao et al. 2016)]GGG78999.1 sugar ABC transporter permease [Paenibacillus radicis (ex Gao et al. 2016)]
MVKDKKDFLFMTVVYAFIVAIFIVTFYPFWNIFIISLNSAEDTLRGHLYLWPREFSLASYKQILTDSEIWMAIRITLLRTLIGTPLAVITISMLSFSLSKKELVAGRFWTLYFVFTMYFGGGLIPYYMVLKSYHLIDNFMVFVVPGLMNVFYMIIVRTFMQGLPQELDESAKIDGANYIQIFFRIILPLTTPVLATIGLFTAISHWNSWFDSYVFTYNPDLKTLQAVLVKILNQYQTGSMVGDAQAMANSAKRMAVSPDTIRMAATMVATLPIIMVYPFLQKYFVKGMTLGAVKS